MAKGKKAIKMGNKLENAKEKFTNSLGGLAIVAGFIYVVIALFHWAATGSPTLIGWTAGIIVVAAIGFSAWESLLFRVILVFGVVAILGILAVAAVEGSNAITLANKQKRIAEQQAKIPPPVIITDENVQEGMEALFSRGNYDAGTIALLVFAMSLGSMVAVYLSTIKSISVPVNILIIIIGGTLSIMWLLPSNNNYNQAQRTVAQNIFLWGAMSKGLWSLILNVFGRASSLITGGAADKNAFVVIIAAGVALPLSYLPVLLGIELFTYDMIINAALDTGLPASYSWSMYLTGVGVGQFLPSATGSLLMILWNWLSKE